MLTDFPTFVGIVLTLTAFTKGLPLIDKIPTRFWSFVISFGVLLAFNLRANTFTTWDILMYAINAVMISSSANGISDINNKKKEGATNGKN